MASAPEARDRQQRQARQPRVGPPAGPEPAHDPVGVAPPAHAVVPRDLAAVAPPPRCSPAASPSSPGGHLERAAVARFAPARAGLGIMNRSHEFNRHARSRLGVERHDRRPPPRWAAATTPGLSSRRGPRGPSGVNATAWPAWSSRTAPSSARARAPGARAAHRADSPATRAKSARYWPSRASLTTMAIDCRR